MMYGVSTLERGYWIYDGPRWLSPLTRFPWGRKMLVRYYRLRSLGEMQSEINARYAARFDALTIEQTLDENLNLRGAN